MMTKQCTCKDGKKCAACTAKHNYLDSHHKLNPGSEPVKKAMQKVAYGRYGEDHDDHSIMPDLTTLALLGGGSALAHSALMNSRGQFARAYQNNLGNAIREQANKVRGSMGMSPVAMPPGRLRGSLMDAHDKVMGGLQGIKNIHDTYAPLIAPAAGAAASLYGGHKWLMDSNDEYKNFVNAAKQKGQAAVGAVRNAGQTAAGAVRNAASKLKMPKKTP